MRAAPRQMVAAFMGNPYVAAAKTLGLRLSDVVLHKQYTGANPAIAAVYAPLRACHLVMASVMTLIVLFGMILPLESAAVAKGTIVVISSKKTVQHLEGGIIRRILVQDGDRVEKGQKLVELSDVAPQASQSIAQTELWSLRAAEARLIALKEGKDGVVFPPEMEEARAANPELDKAMTTQAALFSNQKDTQASKLGILEERINQSHEEMVGLRAQIESAEGQIALSRQESDAVKKLVDKGYAPLPRYLALKRTEEELTGNRGQAMAQIAKSEQAINEIQMQMLNTRNEFNTQLADELRDTQSKLHDQEEKLRTASDVMARTVITAPTEGIVTGLKFHGEGGVITPGAAILDIVPQTEQLVVEAHIQPHDIDRVTPGMECRLAFSAFNARSMPRLTGSLTQISADIVSDPHSPQPTSYYVARVEVNARQLAALNGNVHLTSGMPVDVYIRTGSRSFLGYLFAPLTDSLQKAFTEN